MGLKKETTFMKIKFKPRIQGKLSYPTFVVGINPGRPSKNQTTFLTWTGPRGASLIQRAYNDIPNLYFTNVFNWYVHPKRNLNQLIKQGIKELQCDIDRYHPVKIICLGNFVFNVVNGLHLHETTICKLPHPSFIFRFKKNHRQYVKRLQKELT